MLLALGVAFYLMFTVGEMAGGDVAGIQHLPPALVLAALPWLAVILVLAVPLGAAYVVALVVQDLSLTWGVEIALPPVVTGLPLLWSGRRERASRHAEDHRADGLAV